MSVTIRSGGVALAFSSACSPLCAASVLKPSAVNTVIYSWRVSGSSSTISTSGAECGMAGWFPSISRGC
jgi:hypothetical protein